MRAIDLTGLRYGKLEVVSLSTVRLHDRISWNCICNCGQTKVVTGNDLRAGKITTCGSFTCKVFSTIEANKAKETHGKSNSRLYRIWAGMKGRCNYKTKHGYNRYGERGIKYSPEWEEFVMFLKDMGDSYHEGLTLDRINNDGNYTKDNCRWTTRKEQSRNRSSNRLVTYNGETKCAYDWAKYFDINTKTLIDRLNRGWSIDRALTTKGKTGYEGNDI